MWDSDLASFMAGHICSACPWLQEVALGLTASDDRPAVSDRIERANKIFSAFGSGAKKMYPVKHLTKQQLYESMPKELSSLTWSCRTPIYNNGKPSPCNR